MRSFCLSSYLKEWCQQHSAQAVDLIHPFSHNAMKRLRMDDQKEIKEGIIDKVQEVVEKAKEQLKNVQCPEHGQALKRLDFNREEGRFKIETCCDDGEKLVNSAIQNLG